jgi:hypothetical protein
MHFLLYADIELETEHEATATADRLVISVERLQQAGSARYFMRARARAGTSVLTTCNRDLEIDRAQ